MTKHRSSLYQSEQDRADMALVREHDGDRGLSDLVNRLVRQRANQIRAACPEPWNLPGADDPTDEDLRRHEQRQRHTGHSWDED